MKKIEAGSLAIALLLFSVGCSVKELRDDCPCRLILDFSETDTLSVRELVVHAEDRAGTSYDCNLAAAEFMPEYHMEVSRSSLLLNVCSGDAGLYEPGRGLVIPYGSACPEVFMYMKEIDALGEFVRDTVSLHKNHCVLTVIFEKEDSPLYGLCLKGGVAGYGKDCRPMAGEFSFVPIESGDRSYRAVIPRQLDSSLMLEVDDGSAMIRRFALGEMIAAGGYDWDSRDLDDLTVRIDWASTDIMITINGWDWSYEYQIVI